jgi:hypothetical protein
MLSRRAHAVGKQFKPKRLAQPLSPRDPSTTADPSIGELKR